MAANSCCDSGVVAELPLAVDEELRRFRRASSICPGCGYSILTSSFGGGMAES